MLPEIKTEWLLYFETLLALGSFAQAADQLAISPQNLRHNIKQLESALQTPLLDRSRPGQLALTPAGELFLTQNRELLQELQGLKDDFLPPAQRILGCLLRYTPYTCLLDKQAGIELFDFDLVTGFNTQEQVLEALLGKRIEAGFLQDPLAHPDFSCQRLPVTGSIWGATPQSLPWSELKFIRYLALDQPYDLFWPEAEYPREVIAESSSLDMVKVLSAKGLGAVYLPDSLTEPEVSAGLLTRQTQAPFKLPPLYFVRRLIS